jgi:hypothetical protein
MKEAYRSKTESLFRGNVRSVESQPNRPAETFATGRRGVEVRVWADRSSWGDIEWNFDIVRNLHGKDGSWTSKSFNFRDVKDVMRGIHLASCWIKKAKKRANRRRLFWI